MGRSRRQSKHVREQALTPCAQKPRKGEATGTLPYEVTGAASEHAGRRVRGLCLWTPPSRHGPGTEPLGATYRPPQHSQGLGTPTSSFIRVSRSFLAALKMASVFELATGSSELPSE